MAASRIGVIVVAAVIEKDGLVLIGQRRRGRRHGLKWEFPGGKVEPGETPRAALRRELEEELSIRAAVGAEMIRYEHTYPRRKSILLIFYRVRRFEGTPVNREFEQIRWEAPEKLREYDFLDGDADFLRRFARGDFRALT